MTEKDRSQPSKFSREVQASEDLRGGKTREEFDEEIRIRKAKLQVLRDEMKRKAAEEKVQQQKEEQLSEEDDDNDEMEDKSS